MKEIGEVCRENKVFFHSDAAQAVGKMPVDVNEHKIDLMSISGHKIYGPKGVGASSYCNCSIPLCCGLQLVLPKLCLSFKITQCEASLHTHCEVVDKSHVEVDVVSAARVTGALYIRRRPRVRLEPLMSGGGQERGLRSGTLPHPLIVGFGAACKIAAEEMDNDRRCVPSQFDQHCAQLQGIMLNFITNYLCH